MTEDELLAHLDEHGGVVTGFDWEYIEALVERCRRLREALDTCDRVFVRYNMKVNEAIEALARDAADQPLATGEPGQEKP